MRGGHLCGNELAELLNCTIVQYGNYCVKEAACSVEL